MKRFVAVAGIAIAAACTPIEPVPLSNAPVNRCGCEGYSAEVDARCSARSNRCESGPSGSRPSYPFFLVVHVPDSAFYAAAQTVVLYSGPLNGAPAFTRTSSGTAFTNCKGPQCVSVGGMTLMSSLYRVTASQSARVGYPLKDRQAIPARVELEPVAATGTPDFPAGLPIESRFVASRLQGNQPETSTALPSGIYHRVLYPEPPFDALFPPRAAVDPSKVELKDRYRIELEAPPPQSIRDPRTLDYRPFVEEFVLTDDALDPLATRGVTVQRAEGLDGWQVWVADSATKRRISTRKTLSGTSETLTLETSGETRTPNGGLGDQVEVVVSPPADYLGVPRFINPVIGGDLGIIRYPSIFKPASVVGRVIEPDTEELLGFAARLSFESTGIQTVSGQTTPLLHYSTSLATDDSGRFATVLPPGTYDVTIEPALGTGFAVARQSVNVDSSFTGLYLRPPKRTVVRGQVVLADQRPLAEASILATPGTPKSPSSAKPRPSHTRTDPEGRFSFELDQGPYVITVIPAAGTGFPRVAIRSDIPAYDTDLSEIVVPPPVALSFKLAGEEWNERPVVNAIVRVFTVPAVDAPTASPEAVEIGIGTTDTAGQVEILLAPNPP